MGSKIGYPNKILNLTQLDLDYQEVLIKNSPPPPPIFLSEPFIILHCIFSYTSTKVIFCSTLCGQDAMKSGAKFKKSSNLRPMRSKNIVN